MRGIFAGAVVLAATCAPGFAAGEGCIEISNDLDRLACYDKALGRTPERKIEPTAKGKWRVQKETSKLTDQPTVVLNLRSEEEVDCGWNRGGKISLILRCMENKTVLYFNTGCHMADSIGGYGRITYRLDSDKAKTAEGDASTDNRALGLWSGGRSIPVIKSMFGKSEMVVRMTPFSESPFTATFDITGLEESIKPLREACHW
ncbi:type VI secretion system-associated protein TagO [uncultured Nitratireductor sp.]|uniref:type VI secretion system-associated protein TagO n=1 Tax=uncultured Nitratireductor sp. TaxID=520953 RepID=UPI00262E2EFB|nr:type VI secretion system-associated protein TagO [uncultured Nitratireductor sp.]